MSELSRCEGDRAARRDQIQSLVEALIQDAKDLHPKGFNIGAISRTRIFLVDGISVNVFLSIKKDHPHNKCTIRVESLHHKYLKYKSAISRKTFSKNPKKGFDVEKIVSHIEDWVLTHKDLDNKIQEAERKSKELLRERQRLIKRGIPRECIRKNIENKLVLHIESPEVIREVLLKTWGVDIDAEDQ